MRQVYRYASTVAAVAAALGTASCSSVRPRIDLTPSFAATAELTRADELVRAGCYTCLTQALGIYEKLAAEPTVVPVAAYRAVDTALLLAVRERELGLGSGRSRQIAVELASRLPAPADYSPLLAMVDAIGWTRTGVSAELEDTILSAQRLVNANFSQWRMNLLAQAPTDQLSAYELIALDCLYSYRLREAKQKPWLLPAGAAPLLRFRAATCSNASPGLLDDVLRDEPRLRELYLWKGERAFAQGSLRTAERHLLTALEEIPALTWAKVVLGHVYLGMEDVESAYRAYHDVTEAVPGQRDAMLGEAKSLSYLDRSGEAIAVLEQIVRLGTWYLGEAHYWLAWNRLHLTELDRANGEVIAARQYLPMDPLVDKLSGRVALARNELERAEREFRAAMEHFAGRQTRDCDTGYLLASVLVMQRKWPEGGLQFGQAVPCFVEDEQAMRRKIDEINAADLPAERKVRLVAAKQKGIAALQSQQARAAYNAAVAYANLGDKEKARPLAERAAQHPDMAELARKLLARLQPGAP
jgi:tetratricopeptide (TPR) repeat protein